MKKKEKSQGINASWVDLFISIGVCMYVWFICILKVVKFTFNNHNLCSVVCSFVFIVSVVVASFPRSQSFPHQPIPVYNLFIKFGAIGDLRSGSS